MSAFQSQDCLHICHQYLYVVYTSGEIKPQFIGLFDRHMFECLDDWFYHFL